MTMKPSYVSGVYAIVHKRSGKQYIGRSINIAERFYQHITALDNDYHPIREMQKLWHRDGQSGFLFKTLKTCPIRKLKELEREYIEKYHPEFNRKKRASLIDSKKKTIVQRLVKAVKLLAGG